MSDPGGIQPASVAPGLLGRIGRLSPWRFVLVMSMVLVAAKLLQLPLWLLVFHYYQPAGTASTEPAWWEEFGWAGTVFVELLLGPWLETLLAQTLWMLITSPRSRPTMVYIVPATIWFCYLHGAASGPGWWPDWDRLDWWLKVLPHAASGFILACTFQHGWKHSWWRGIWMTSMVHCVGNLSARIIIFFLPSNL